MNGGSLEIREVKPEDEGKYQCVAQNIVGLKKSPEATLTVHGKSRFHNNFIKYQGLCFNKASVSILTIIRRAVDY